MPDVGVPDKLRGWGYSLRVLGPLPVLQYHLQWRNPEILCQRVLDLTRELNLRVLIQDPPKSHLTARQLRSVQ